MVIKCNYKGSYIRATWTTQNTKSNGPGKKSAIRNSFGCNDTNKAQVELVPGIKVCSHVTF